MCVSNGELSFEYIFKKFKIYLIHILIYESNFIKFSF